MSRSRSIYHPTKAPRDTWADSFPNWKIIYVQLALSQKSPRKSKDISVLQNCSTWLRHTGSSSLSAARLTAQHRGSLMTITNTCKRIQREALEIHRWMEENKIRWRPISGIMEKMDYTGYFQCGISLNRTLVSKLAWAGGNFHLETELRRVARSTFTPSTRITSPKRSPWRFSCQAWQG